MATLMVLYPVDAGERFDADYYVNGHMKLAADTLKQHGLIEAIANLPEQPGGPYHALSLLRFPDAASLYAALGSPEGTATREDLIKFTDIVPVTQVFVDG